MATMIGYRNLADAAEQIAATREASGLGVRNLLTEYLGEVWRVPTVATGATTDLEVTLPAAAEIGVVALFAPRDSYLASEYSVQLSASAVSMGGTDVVNGADAPLGLPDGLGAWWYWPAAPFTARYLRLRFTAGSAAEYLQFGRLWIGPDFRPTYGADGPGQAMAVASAGQKERAAISGIVSASPGATYRVDPFVLPLLTEAEAKTLRRIALEVGDTGQVVVNARTQDGAESLLLGRFAEPPSPQRAAPRRWRAAISVQEDL